MLSPENIYYITGFHTPGYYFPQCLVVPRGETPTLVLRHLEAPGVANMTWLDKSRGYDDHEDPAHAIAEVAAQHAQSRIGYESESCFLPPGLLARIQDQLGIEAVPYTDLVEQQRVVKSPAEIDLIRLAARHTDAGMAAAFAASQAGVTENHVAGRVYGSMIEDRSSYPSLPPFIATGPTVGTDTCDMEWPTASPRRSAVLRGGRLSRTLRRRSYEDGDRRRSANRDAPHHRRACRR